MGPVRPVWLVQSPEAALALAEEELAKAKQATGGWFQWETCLNRKLREVVCNVSMLWSAQFWKIFR